ncbi:MAG: hypothetical protein JWM37_406 [Candidatus Saccharibacteria bacterium]|nr:hypothetical protein [Candidatus Saccharibacteria bacterium]
MGEFTGEHDQLLQIEQALERATLAVTGEEGHDPLEVFPNPATAERRADVAWDPRLTEDQEQAFRSSMAEIGPGRPTDIGPAEVGFGNIDYVAVLEGGQPHKMVAQLQVVRAHGRDLMPGMIVQTASADRTIGANERAFMAGHLGCEESEVADTELGVAEQILRHEADFEAVGSEATLEDAYVAGEVSLMDAIHIGNFIHPDPESPSDGTRVNVILVGVKRVYADDGSGQYSQASNADKISQALNFSTFQRNIGFVTSSTYQPSNVISARQVAFDTSSNVQVLSYGTETLARVKVAQPEQPSLAQLGGEAFKTALLLTEHGEEQASR